MMKIELTLIDDGFKMTDTLTLDVDEDFDKARAAVIKIIGRFQDSLLTYHVRPKATAMLITKAIAARD